jgi:DNA-directed RNA polymerase specialized sigma24 family protein
MKIPPTSSSPGAFDALLAPHESAMRATIAAVLRHRADASIDEALQDARLYLLRRLDRFNPQYPFGVFARALSRTIARRYLLSPTRIVQSGADGLQGEDDLPNDPSPEQLEALPAGLKDSLGVNRFSAPDENTCTASPRFLELLEAFLRYGGYPHQQVVFGFGILLWGTAKAHEKGTGGDGRQRPDKVPVTGDPDRVVREVGPLALAVSSTTFLNDLSDELRLPDGYVGRVRRPLDYRLSLTGGQLFARDASSARQFSGLAGSVTGQCRLDEYWGGDPRRSVADWTRGVKERIRRICLNPAAARSSPLPQPEEVP